MNNKALLLKLNILYIRALFVVKKLINRGTSKAADMVKNYLSHLHQVIEKHAQIR